MASRLVILQAFDIQYQGQSIGREVTVEIDLAGELLVTNKRIAPGQTKSLVMEIGQFWTNAEQFPLSGSIRIVENDPVYSEVGIVPVAWNLDLRSDGLHESSHTLELTETRPHSSGATALFLVRLRAQSTRATRFIVESKNGWLGVRLDDSQTQVSLPETIAVEVSRVEAGREYFIIKEGAYRGRRASIKLNRDGSSLLSSEDPRGPAAKLTYSISRKTLKLAGNTYTTIDYPEMPWAKGTYDVELPDAPHRGGLNYPNTSRARTWFRVGHNGDRYIHTGAASLGCVTVLERDRWDQLCAILVRARKGDGLSIGTLQVVD